MNTIEVKDIIKKRRLKLGLSYAELGKLCDVDKTTVRKWELGLIENMKRDKMVLLSKALGVSPLVLLGIEEYIPEDHLDVNTNDKISVYANIFANKFENPIDKIDNPYPHEKGDFFALEINYDKTKSIILDHKVYAIFKHQNSAKNGDTIVVSIANEKALIMKFYTVDDVVILRPITNEDCEPITIVGNKVNDVCILGKFVGIVSPFVD